MKRIRLAALALAVTLACVGCSDDEPEPKFAPSESGSPSPTETETTSEPPEPEKLSPEETVRAWVEARNITVRTGKADDVYALSTEDCESCTNSVEPVRQVYADGGRLDTFGWRVRSAKREQDFPSSRHVAAAVVFEAGRTYPTAKADPIAYDREHHIIRFTLANEDGQWKIDHFAYAS